MNVDIDFMEAVNGIKRIINFEKKGICTTCNGTKTKSGTGPSKC